MQYGAPAVLIGWALTFVLFCVGLTATLIIGDGDAGMGWNFLIAWPLRRVRKQWVHVLGFAVGIGGGAAVGRARVIRMVARKNALVEQSDPAMVARYGR